jgi:hypothetical protein
LAIGFAAVAIVVVLVLRHAAVQPPVVVAAGKAGSQTAAAAASTAAAAVGAGPAAQAPVPVPVTPVIVERRAGDSPASVQQRAAEPARTTLPEARPPRPAAPARTAAAPATGDGTVLLAMAPWGEVLVTLDARRKLVESVRKRLVQLSQMITAEQAMILVTAVISLVKDNVDDQRALARISDGLRRLTSSDR